jgi:hypothetical protein
MSSLDLETATPVQSVKSARRPSFVETIKAAQVCKATEVSGTEALFALGDALINDCGPPGSAGVHTGSDDLLKKAQKALARKDLIYSFDHLRNLRTVAHAFPPGVRTPALAWSVHRAAGNPERLSELIAEAKLEGKELTAPFVRQSNKKLKEQREKKEREQHEKLNGRPQEDPAYVLAQQRFLSAINKALDLLDAEWSVFRDYRSQLEATDAQGIVTELEALADSAKDIITRLQPASE